MRQEKPSLQGASVAELVDATDSKSVSGDRVPVRVRPEVPRGHGARLELEVDERAIAKRDEGDRNRHDRTICHREAIGGEALDHLLRTKPV
jgi:hypothetical protein